MLSHKKLLLCKNNRWLTFFRLYLRVFLMQKMNKIGYLLNYFPLLWQIFCAIIVLEWLFTAENVLKSVSDFHYNALKIKLYQERCEQYKNFVHWKLWNASCNWRYGNNKSAKNQTAVFFFLFFLISTFSHIFLK